MIGLLVLGIVVGLFVLPVVALVQASRAAAHARELRDRLARLESQLHQVERSARREIAAAGIGSTGEGPRPRTRPAEEGAGQASMRHAEASDASEARAASSAAREAPAAAGPAVPPQPDVPPPTVVPPPLAPTAAATGSGDAPPGIGLGQGGTTAPVPPSPIGEGAAGSEPPDAPVEAPRPGPPGPPARPTPSPRPPAGPPPPAAGGPPSLEALIGVRFFAWLGGGALLLAMIFLVAYSIEQGWWGRVPPGVKVGFAMLVGAVAVIGAEPLWGNKFRVQAGALAGAGIGTVYAALYAGRALYDLFPYWFTFGAMVFVTAVAVGLSVYHRSQFVAFLGLLGGFATPLLLSTGSDRPVALFGYVMLLDAALLVVARKGRWIALAAFAVIGTLVLQGSWLTTRLDVGEGGLALALFVGLAAVFGIGAWRSSERAEEVPGLAAVSSVGFGLVFVAAVAVLGRPAVIPGPSAILAWLAVMGAGALALAGVTRQPAVAVLAFLAVGAEATVATVSWFSVGRGIAPGEVGRFVLALLALPALATGASLRWPDRAGTLAAALGTALIALLPAGAAVVGEFDDAELHAAGLMIPLGFAALGLLGALPTRRGELPLVALVSSVLLVAAWQAGAPPPDAQVAGLLAEAVLVAAFVLYPSLAGARHAGQLGPTLAAAVAGPALFLPMYSSWKRAYGTSAIGLLPVSLGALALFGADRVRREIGDRSDPSVRRDLLIFLAVAFGFAGLAVGVQFEKEWLTIGWAIEVLALAALYRRVPHPGLRYFGAVLAAIVTVRLLFNPWVLGYHPRPDVPVFNWYLAAYGIPAACLLGAARLFDPGDAARGTFTLSSALRVAAVLVGFWLLNIEVVDLATPRDGAAHLSFRVPREFLPSLSMSLAWAAYAGVLVGLGIARDHRGARTLGLAFFALAIAKVFGYDLFRLGGLYRVLALLGLAVSLWAVSLAFQRLVLRKGESA